MINYYKRALEKFVFLKSQERFEELMIFYHLLNLIPEKTFNQLIEDTKDEIDSFGNDYSFTQFHKYFRQMDIMDNGRLDMIMWNFIFLSKIPQKVYYGIQNKDYNGKPLDPDFLIFED